MTSVSPARVLMMLVGEDEKNAGIDADEPRALAASYYLFAECGTEVVLASEQGGYPVIAGQMRKCTDDPAIARFLDDHNARSEIADTLSLSQVVMEDFDALVIFSSGTDLQPPVARLITAFETGRKVVVLPGPVRDMADAPDPRLVIRQRGDLAGWVREVTDLISAAS